MLFLISIALAIPTYGLSIVVFLIFSWLKTVKTINRIPIILDNLSDNNSALSTCVDGLKFPTLLGFAKENGKISTESKDYFEFTTPKEREQKFYYKATVNREEKTNNAIIHVSKYIFIRSDDFTATTIPIELYDYWSESGIKDDTICNYYWYDLEAELNIMAEEFRTGGTIEDIHYRCENEIPKKERIATLDNVRCNPKNPIF